MSVPTRDCRVMCAISLLIIPTIAYGGLTLLGVVTGGGAGSPPSTLALDAQQAALWRSGHAHAGTWMILALVLQLLLDGTRLPGALRWSARIGAPLSAVLVSAGFFALAFIPAGRWLIYAGGGVLTATLCVTALGLLRRPTNAGTPGDDRHAVNQPG